MPTLKDAIEEALKDAEYRHHVQQAQRANERHRVLGCRVDLIAAQHHEQQMEKLLGRIVRRLRGGAN